MYSESDLEAAVKAGALSPAQAQTFRNFVAEGRSSPAVDEESFRLLTGFNDIFVAISAVILLVAVAWIGHAIPPNIDGDGPSPWSALFVALTAWGLAEFFTRKRRMALPSILLLLAFVGASLATAAIAMVTGIGEHNLEGNDRAGALILAFSTAIGAAAAWAHWRRFRVPITVAAGAATVVGLVLALIASAIGDVPERRDVLLGFGFVLGIGVFMLAMRWDWSDPTRQTRRSDVAFWLHLLAAPLIVHPIFSLLGITQGHASTPIAIVVMLVYIGLGITALAIDRRALLVSALGYVLWALNNLFESYGVVELSIAFTALVIGSALLLLSAFWHNARRGVVGSLPPMLRMKLPTLEQPASA
jgi:hypothetical protein